MQKKFIALAVAGLVSGAAFAQTNVTIYGVADASFDVASVTGAAYNTNLERSNFNRISTNSSLIGFRGTEALGNGLNAIFQFESAVGFDSAAALSVNRDSFVGLQSDKFGTVRLGNLTTPTRALGAAVDMNAGATGPGGNSSIIGKVLGGNAMVAGTTETFATEALTNNGAAGYNAGYFDTRFTNTIMYSTPSFGGFAAGIAYRAGEDKNLDTVDNLQGQANTRAYDMGVTYSNGPIFAGLSYGKVDEKRSSVYSGCTVTGIVSETCKADESSIWRAAGAYTFNGGHKISALYERNRADFNDGADSANVRQAVWGVGGKFMATPALALIGQYYQSKDASISNTADDGDTGAKMWELGAEYSLSKRTMLKASYTQLNNDNDVANDFNVGAVGGGFGSGAKVKVWSAGVRHSF